MVKANRKRKEDLSGSSPQHLSNQNLTLLPLPTEKVTLLPKRSQSFLMAFQRPNRYPSLTLLDLHPPSSSPTFFANDFLPKRSPVHYKTLTPLTQQSFIKGRQVPHPQPSLAFIRVDNSPLNQIRFLLQGPFSPKNVSLDLLQPQPNYFWDKKKRTKKKQACWRRCYKLE